MKLFKLIAASALVALMASNALAESKYDKPGFVTEIEKGRLWVFAADSEEYKKFKAQGEPAVQYTRVKAGPDGMTLKAAKNETIDAYIQAK